MMMLSEKKIGDSVILNGEKYTKVAKNYWKSDRKEMFEQSLQVEMDIYEAERLAKKQKKAEKSVDFGRCEKKEIVNATNYEEKEAE